MIRALAAPVLALALASPQATAPQPTEEPAMKDVPKQMTHYVVALLKRGPTWKRQHTPGVQKVLQEHVSYLRRRIDAKNYVLAGPFTDDSPLAGMVIVATASEKEAKAMMDEDPAVRSRRASPSNCTPSCCRH